MRHGECIGKSWRDILSIDVPLEEVLDDALEALSTYYLIQLKEELADTRCTSGYMRGASSGWRRKSEESTTGAASHSWGRWYRGGSSVQQGRVGSRRTFLRAWPDCKSGGKRQARCHRRSSPSCSSSITRSAAPSAHQALRIEEADRVRARHCAFGRNHGIVRDHQHITRKRSLAAGAVAL